jgi:glycosyltransferase involved in cell wall biosynthesis
MVQAIRKLRPDIVHIHYAGVYELLAAYLAGRPYVVTMMGSDILKKLDGSMSGPKKRVMTFCLKRAALLNSVSDQITAIVKKHIGANKRIIKVAWGIDHDVFRPLDKADSRRQLGIDESKFVILCPRLIKPLYNIHIIVKAVALLPAGIDWQLLLCAYNADSNYLSEIMRLIRSLGITDRVRVLDAINNDSMPPLYNSADISVMIPSSDGMPISLLEGMACGVPHIVGNIPGYDEIVCNNVSTVYVNIDEHDLASAITRMYGDKRLLSNISAAALSAVRERSNFQRDVESIEAEYYRIAKIRP